MPWLHHSNKHSMNITLFVKKPLNLHLKKPHREFERVDKLKPSTTVRRRLFISKLATTESLLFSALYSERRQTEYLVKSSFKSSSTLEEEPYRMPRKCC